MTPTLSKRRACGRMSPTGSIRRRRRGYLLLEVAFAAALTTVAISGLLVQLGDAGLRSTASSRDVTAQGILRREIERVRSQSFLTVTSQAPTAVPGLTGTYKTSRTITTGNEVLFAAATTKFKNVTVTVAHTNGDAVRTITGVVRLYE